MTHISGWPWGFVEEVVSNITDNFASPTYTIVTRPIRHLDPNRTISIFPVDRTQPEYIGDKVIGQMEPIVKRYNYRTQVFAKVVNEAEGRAYNSLDAKLLEAVLYRDLSLAASLPTLVEDVLGTRERFTRWGMGSTRYLNNQLDGAFMFLAQCDLWVETEIVKL